ncbi:hypothetical protein HK096_002730, partial [Nowakowskiella sp. JEL0078]
MLTENVLTKYTYIWCDVLCIMQDTAGIDAAMVKKDKETQVSRMSDAYRSAKEVFILIPEFEFHTYVDKVTTLVDKWKNDTTEKVLNTVMEGEMIKDANYLRKEGQKIFTEGWFTRIWTIQEGHININTTFLSNDGDVTSKELTELRKKTSELVDTGGSTSHAQYILHSLCDSLTEYTTFQENWTLAQVTSFAKGRKCQREEDKVYGILALLDHRIIQEISISYNDNDGTGSFETRWKSLISITAKYDSSWQTVIGPVSPLSGLSWTVEIGSPCIRANTNLESGAITRANESVRDEITHVKCKSVEAKVSSVLSIIPINPNNIMVTTLQNVFGVSWFLPIRGTLFSMDISKGICLMLYWAFDFIYRWTYRTLGFNTTSDVIRYGDIRANDSLNAIIPLLDEHACLVKFKTTNNKTIVLAVHEKVDTKFDSVVLMDNSPTYGKYHTIAVAKHHRNNEQGLKEVSRLCQGILVFGSWDGNMQEGLPPKFFEETTFKL